MGVVVSGGNGYVIAGVTNANTYSLVKKDIENFIQSLEFDATPTMRSEASMNSAEEYPPYDTYDPTPARYTPPAEDYSVMNKNFVSEQFDDGSESAVGEESIDGSNIFYSILSGSCTTCDSAEAEGLKK